MFDLQYFIDKYASIKSDLIAKHPDFAVQIEQLSAADPSKKDKYLRYSVKHLIEGSPSDELIDLINKFDQKLSIIPNKDINTYSLKDLKTLVSSFQNLKSKREEKNDIKVSGGQKVFEDDQCVVIFIKSKAAACFYGVDTKWCVTMRTEQYYENYSAADKLLYFVLRKDLAKENNKYKVAILYVRDGDQVSERLMYDAIDNESSGTDYLNGLKSANQIISLTQALAAKEPETPISVAKKDLQNYSNAIYNEHDDLEPFKQNAYKHLKNEDVRSYYAAHQDTPAELLSHLSSDKDDYIRELVYNNENTPNASKEQLGKTLDIVKAQDEGTSPEELLRLAGSNRADIKELVALNVNTPTQALDILAHDHNKDVRKNVVGNAKTSEKSLIHLAKDPESSVQEAFLNGNINITPSIANLLVLSKFDFISHNAIEYFSTDISPDVLKKAIIKKMHGIDGEESLNSFMLVVLRNIEKFDNSEIHKIGNDLPQIYDFLAGSYAIKTPSIFTMLFNLKDREVSINLTKNINASPEQIEFIAAHDTDADVKSLAQKRVDNRGNYNYDYTEASSNSNSLFKLARQLYLKNIK
jgi:hypothetical protein